jgi:hypothetical protein
MHLKLSRLRHGGSEISERKKRHLVLRINQRNRPEIRVNLGQPNSVAKQRWQVVAGGSLRKGQRIER